MKQGSSALVLLALWTAKMWRAILDIYGILSNLCFSSEMPAAPYHYQPVVGTKNVSRQCHMSPLRHKSPPVENH